MTNFSIIIWTIFILYNGNKFKFLLSFSFATFSLLFQLNMMSQKQEFSFNFFYFILSIGFCFLIINLLIHVFNILVCGLFSLLDSYSFPWVLSVINVSFIVKTLHICIMRSNLNEYPGLLPCIYFCIFTLKYLFWQLHIYTLCIMMVFLSLSLLSLVSLLAHLMAFLNSS